MASLAIAGAVLLLWNVFAASFSGASVGARTRGHVTQDASRNDDLARTLNETGVIGDSRVVMFGASQIDAVKGDPDFSPRALPFVVSAILDSAKKSHMIVDLSGPGQQVTESAAILLSAVERLRPSVVVLGIGLFSMSSTAIRPALQAAIDFGRIRVEISAVSDSLLTANNRSLALSVLHSGKQGDSPTTIQQYADAYIGKKLNRLTPMIANRRAIYNVVIDQPLRRDLVRFVQRRRGPVLTARTYEIGEQYAASLAAVDAMGSVLATRHVPFVVCVLPYEHTRTPPPYSAETSNKVLTDLAEISRRDGFAILDLSDALTVGDFGLYDDGSPDGLHFRAHGHAVVGQALANSISNLLRTDAEGRTVRGAARSGGR